MRRSSAGELSAKLRDFVSAADGVMLMSEGLEERLGCAAEDDSIHSDTQRITASFKCGDQTVAGPLVSMSKNWGVNGSVSSLVMLVSAHDAMQALVTAAPKTITIKLGEQEQVIKIEHASVQIEQVVLSGFKLPDGSVLLRLSAA